MTVRIIHNCPYCGATVDVQVGSDVLAIGEPIVHCPRCNKPIKTGKTKLSDLTPAQRKTKSVIAGIQGVGHLLLWGPLLGFLLFAMAEKFFPENRTVAAVVCTLWSVVSSAWNGFSTYHVVRMIYFGTQDGQGEQPS